VQIGVAVGLPKMNITYLANREAVECCRDAWITNLDVP
jgi:hypothetical protein